MDRVPQLWRTSEAVSSPVPFLPCINKTLANRRTLLQYGEAFVAALVCNAGVFWASGPFQVQKEGYSALDDKASLNAFHNNVFR